MASGDRSQASMPMTGVQALDFELAEEMAISLGRAGEAVAKALQDLGEVDREHPDRPVRLKTAARAVHAYFIQRELCGLRRHDDAIAHYGISREVIARLGAS
jgi:hypothetical protein